MDQGWCGYLCFELAKAAISDSAGPARVFKKEEERVMVRILLTAMLWVVLAAWAMTVATFAETKQAQSDLGRQKKPAGAGLAASSGKKEPANSKVKVAAKKEVAPSESKAATKKEPGAKATGRLPKFYGQLDLDDDQQSKIAAIQESYRSRSAELRKQIATLSAERDEEISRVLKPKQREQLKALMAEEPEKNARGARSGVGTAQGPDREKKGAEATTTAKR
jgi:Spy/CpxP family protein refolding chaperone